MASKLICVTALLALAILAALPHGSSSFPVQYAPQRHSYNLHSAFTAEDINQLSGKSRRNIARTIAEVEKVLASDPKLPRLTRGEIVALFEQVAREELAKSMMVGDYTRAKQMRALMVVLPYSTSIKDDGNNAIQELYNKAPVTRVIESEVTPIVAVTQKPTTTLGTTTKATTTTRRTSPEFVIPQDYMTTSFRPLPAYDRIFSTTTERQVTIPQDLEFILNEMKTENVPRTTQKGDANDVAPDVQNVLESLGLWVENERPMVFSKQTISENFAPFELDFETGTTRTIEPKEKPQEQPMRKSPSPEVAPTDFAAFKPIPKLDKAEIPIENYEYFKSLGLLDSSKESRSYSSKTPAQNKPIVSSKVENKPLFSDKAEGFSRRKSDVSYETDILTKISKQDREQLLDVLKKLESQVGAGKIGPNPVDNSEINVTKKDYKRQEATTEISAPVKFSFNFDSEGAEKDKDTKDTTSDDAETLSEDLPLITPDDGQERIVNKGSVSADPQTTTTSSSTSTTTQSSSISSDSDAESFTLPPLVGDDMKLDNLEDTGGLDPLAEAEAPPVKKNGFYFLADWNSFLEVGEGKDRVEVRFTPRVGDSRLFIPVNVP